MNFNNYSFLDGTIVNKELMFLVGVDDMKSEKNEKHGLIFQHYQNKWQVLEIEEKPISSAFIENPSKKLVVIAENGRVTVLGNGLVIKETIAIGEKSPKIKGPLIEVRCVSRGKAYAVGTGRQAYRKDDDNLWIRIDQSALPPEDKAADVSFHSIDGFGPDDIYAVGWEGEIWHFDGQNWEQKASPSNLALYKVFCCQDGYVYACGQLGLLIKGRGDEWLIIEHEETMDDFWGIEGFEGKIYISSLNFLYELSENGLRQIQMDVSPLTCYTLSASDGKLWSIGAKDVVEFDGHNWTRII